MSIELGDKVKDSITGFAGIVVAITDWLHGCRRITVQPEKVGSEGKPIETATFDEPQIIVVKAANPKPPIRRTGGPRPDPVQKVTPR